MKKSIHIVSGFQGSIGEISQDLYVGLKKDFVVTRESLNLPSQKDILLTHLIHEKIIDKYLDEFNSFKKKVLIQPIDGTTIQKKYIDYMNLYDLIITPASAGKKIMEENGVKSKIVVIPNYYMKEDLEFSGGNVLEKEIGEKIVFYHESKSSWEDRKNIEFMYEVFISSFADTEFHNKVILIHKDFNNNECHEIKEKVKSKIVSLQNKYLKPPLVIKITQNLDKGKLKILWNRMDFFISMSKVEGFCIPMLRAALLKKPIICIDNKYSGYQDFLNQSNSFKIPCLYKESGEKSFIHDEKSLLAEADKSMASMILYNSIKDGNFRKMGILNQEDYLFENVLKNYKKEINV